MSRDDTQKMSRDASEGSHCTHLTYILHQAVLPNYCSICVFFAKLHGLFARRNIDANAGEKFIQKRNDIRIKRMIHMLLMATIAPAPLLLAASAPCRSSNLRWRVTCCNEQRKTGDNFAIFSCTLTSAMLLLLLLLMPSTDDTPFPRPAAT
jgi:hypothetical protein